jgi:hypothetical protein
VESPRTLYRRWQLDELLAKYDGLEVVPDPETDLVVTGELAFRVQGPAGDPLEDRYRVRLCIPVGFPRELPVVFETGGKIPPDFHKLSDGSLCLGAPTELRLKLHPAATLITLVEVVVIPYLFGYSHFAKFGVLPFGELEHGVDGIRQHFAALFRVSDREAATEFVRLTALKRRRANKAPCPCASGRRLGRCHHLQVNRLRDRLGRGWFSEQYRRLTGRTQPDG